MDGRSFYCLVLLVVFLMISCICAQNSPVTSTPKPSAAGGTPALTSTAAGNPSQKPSAAGRNPATISTAAGASTKKASGASAAPVQSSPKAASTTTKHCVKGNCTAPAGHDDSCMKDIKGTCPFIGSCTTTVTKNKTHTVFSLGCGQASCPATTPSTTMKPGSTAAPATTRITSTCCREALCNKFQPKSTAVRVSTNVLLFGGFILLITLL